MKRFALSALVAILVLFSAALVKAGSGDLWAVAVQGTDVIRVNSSGDLVPGVANTYDLGSSSLTWADLSMAGTLTQNGSTVLGDAHTDTINIKGAPTVTDLDGGDAGTFNKMTSRLNVRQSSGVGLTNTGYLLIEDAETISDWTATSNVTQTQSTTHFRYGSNSLQLAFASAAVAGNGSAFTISNGNWSGNENVGFWIYTDTALAAGDLVVTITDGGAGATSVNVPAVSSTGTWTFVTVDISGVADGSKDDVDGFAIALSSQGATALGAFTINLDTVIKWDNNNDLSIGGTVTDGGFIGLIAIPTSSGTNNTLTTLAEGTDYWIRPGSSGMVIFITDQSAANVLATYAVQ